MLNVALATAEDVVVDNNYGRAELGANVNVLGTAGDPVLNGRATIREGGQIFLAGNTYIVEQGTIDFVNPARIEPDVNLRTRTRIGGYNITLTITGTPEALEHTLQSDPPLGESDIVSLMVTGRTLSEAGQAQTEVAREQLLGYLSGDFLGFAGRAIGLDTIRLERGLAQDTLPTDLALFAGDEDPSSRLTISKNLRRDVEIVLSQNLRSSGGLTWIAMYRPVPPVELRTISRDDNSRSYEFRHTVQFGGGVSSGQPRAAAGIREEPRILSVHFAGDHGIAPRTLESTVSLRPGDRFDFFTWQRDRDELESFLQERNYLEVDVTVARDPAVNSDGEQGLALTYTIDRGPHTTIRVEGHMLPDDLLDQLRDLWARAVFDGFLIEDVRTAVQRSLAAEGYFRPSIEPEIQTTAGEKAIVLKVDAGSQTVDHAIEFTGNREIEAERLLAALGPERQLAAWTDAASVVPVLERFYRGEGFLTAAATVQAPRFEGNSARLPIAIVEGPRFTIGRVAIEGATALDETTLQTAMNMPEGIAYMTLEAEAARQRLELEYRRRGFNSVRADAKTSVDTSTATVTVVMSIAEGPQQVLGDIQIAGAETTRPGVVTSNLDLQIGAPVDLVEWSRARRRLYDTNVFRSVELTPEPLETPPASGGGTQTVRARVTLEEWSRYRLRYGFQLFDEISEIAERSRVLSPGLVADVQDRNLLGRASSTGLAVRFQRDFRIGRAFLSTPTFFGLKIRSGIFVTRSRRDFNEEGTSPFIEDGSGVSLEQRFQPRQTMEVAYSYRFENKRTFDPNPNPLDPFPLDIEVRIGRMTGSLVVEKRDDPFDSTRGWFHSSTFEYSPELLWSDLRFVKYLAQSYYFRPVGPVETPVVFASAGRFGLGRGFDQDLIPSEKFFTGGANSVRGYREDSLGELDFFGDPRGGNAFLQFNQEVRFPVFRWVRGVGFVDAGNVFPTFADFSLSDLKVGTGAGLRISTPFALLRVDFATAVSPQPGQRRTRWYFSIGQAF
jgi:outer membrane protein assembly complex protein YaeT